MEIEEMSDFFTKRIDGYENQMLENVEGCKEGYIKLAEIIPGNCKKLLDLGCGSYFDVLFGEQTFDCAISFQTMHHFSHESKVSLYKKSAKL